METNVIDQKTGKAEAPAATELETDTRGLMRKGLIVLGIGFGGFILWATLAPLDQGVPAPATVTIATKRKPVQHPSGGVIKEILVGEGDEVNEGDVVARLNPAYSKATFEASRQTVLMLQAMRSRLMAEEAGAQAVTFPPELLKSTDPIVQQQVEIQRTLFSARQRALAAAVSEGRESREGQLALIRGLQAQATSQAEQLASLKGELQGMTDLAAEGYAPKSRQLDLERQVAARKGTLVEIRENILRARRTIGEIENRVENRRQEYYKEVNGQQAQVHKELQAELEKFTALQEELGRTELKAPASGQIVGLQVQSVGAVLQPAQRLADVVPKDEALLLEAKLPPMHIDRVKEGQHTDVRFSSFAGSPPIVAEGKVLSVSADVLMDPPGTTAMPMSYYLARVELTPEGMKALGSKAMHPGMQAEVLIKTGERTMMRYILSPLTKRIAGAMKEE
jgi:protease secretion system membrane fusion protein